MVYALVNCSPGPWVPGDGRDLHPSWLGILAFFLTGWVGNIYGVCRGKFTYFARVGWEYTRVSVCRGKFTYFARVGREYTGVCRGKCTLAKRPGFGAGSLAGIEPDFARELTGFCRGNSLYSKGQDFGAWSLAGIEPDFARELTVTCI